MKPKSKRAARKLQLNIAWSNYIEWIAKLEKILRAKPRSLQIDLVGVGEIPADAALRIRAVLLRRSPTTRLVTHAHSTLQGASVMLWLLGDARVIREDARVFFKRADLPEDAEIDPAFNWKRYEMDYQDSFSEIDPDEGDHARVLQIIDEFLPVKEMAGRLIGTSVLRQFGLIDSAGVDVFLANVFAKSKNDVEAAN